MTFTIFLRARIAAEGRAPVAVLPPVGGGGSRGSYPTQGGGAQARRGRCLTRTVRLSPRAAIKPHRGAGAASDHAAWGNVHRAGSSRKNRNLRPVL